MRGSSRSDSDCSLTFQVSDENPNSGRPSIEVARSKDLAVARISASTDRGEHGTGGYSGKGIGLRGQMPLASPGAGRLVTATARHLLLSVCSCS